MPASLSANLASAASRNRSRCSDGNTSGAGSTPLSRSRARVTLCTSVGPSARSQDERLGQVLHERHLVRRAERSVDLQGTGRHVVQHLLHHRLDRGDVGAHRLIVVVLIDLPGGLEGQKPERLDLHPGVGDHLLDHLFVGEHAALGVSGHRTFADHVVDPAHQTRRCASRGGCGHHRGGSERPRRRRRAGRACGRPAPGRSRTYVPFATAAAHRLVAEADVTQHVDARASPRGRRTSNTVGRAARPGRSSPSR